MPNNHYLTKGQNMNGYLIEINENLHEIEYFIHKAKRNKNREIIKGSNVSHNILSKENHKQILQEVIYTIEKLSGREVWKKYL
jgi:hypothetical protein